MKKALKYIAIVVISLLVLSLTLLLSIYIPAVQRWDKSRTYYIGGYSLAGLFSLWAAYQTDVFSGIAAASPSVWFPGFIEYMKEHEIKSETVYLSLGDREEKTRNSVMSQVGNCIRMGYEWLIEHGINCNLEWNQGNHFREPDIRIAKAFAWVMEGK